MPPVPIYVKGGVWSNVEDQILKAAIQKYGTHQWSKVASLLQKKTARQCQSRWNEFLNPSLNFSQFSKEEDAQLLELVRRLPNQWRTIAEVMGRTPQVCIDRYNTLLEGVDSELKLGSSLDFEVGEINLNAESQPAKPDAEELDSMDKEMLAEARARLLNTQGKKATRKIRERMLEESKRVAQLQKRREFKQAGIDSKIKAPKKKYDTEIDYNADVVYEAEPLDGPYDTTQEDERAARAIKNFERSVDRRGLTENQHTSDRKRRAAKKRDRDDGQKVTGNDSVLTNEYKKPKLELPLLGSSEDTNLGETQPRTYHKHSKKFILNLFQQLPPPKNDFEIVLDDEEEEIESSHSIEFELGAQPSESPMIEGDPGVAPEEERSNLLNGLPLPEPVVDPSDPVDREFNELLALSLIGQQKPQRDKEFEIIKQTIEAQLSQREEEVKTHEYEEKVRKLVASAAANIPENIHDTIREIQAKVENHKSILSTIGPLEQQNHSLSEPINSDLLPRLANLRATYFLHYKMYQNEYYAIEARKQRLHDDILGARNSQS